MSQPQQPHWHEPAGQAAGLKVYNTLTRSKVPFVPQSGNTLRWYSCGPTVYDAAHIGHARNYLTFDIIRRILQNYFNYDILYVMNITDVDDKIIIRGRQAHLVKEFCGKHESVSVDLLKYLEAAYIEFAKKKFKLDAAGESVVTAFEAVAGVFKPGQTEEDAKRQMNLEVLRKAREAFAGAKEGDKAGLLLEAFNDVLAADLDAKFGASVTDQRIFRDLTTFWENDFMQDMRSLNILPADVLTRVTEYVPEIVSYVGKIIENGYGYQVDGSVYFDVQAFHGNKGHHYAKLCPWSAGNAAFLEEGEGALGAKLTGKKDPRDFALWKASKDGEPFWASPWGNGRPGWHIECSAMAGSIMPGVIDIHSGGIDLAFPHHDNELAQAEAHFECAQWINYFFHAGHVHIEGHKMSKSLKNFISIKEALQRYTATQLRIMVLQHLWNATVLYRESSMVAAAAYDSMLTNFFQNMEALIREGAARPVDPDAAPSNSHAAAEADLFALLVATQQAVHTAICDSFDTPTVLGALSELISRTNVYVKASPKPSVEVLKTVSAYVTKIMAVFGVVDVGAAAPKDGSASEVLNPILNCVGEFRDAVRAAAKDPALKPTELLRLSDMLRTSLSEFGVVFEDRPGKSTLVKLVDGAQVKRVQEDAAQREAEKMARKMELLAVQEKREAEKRAKAAIRPSEMFVGNAAYSQLDEQGIPTHAASGEELSKNARKKVAKEYEDQQALYQKYSA